MWCKDCNIETNAIKCPVCGEKTVEDVPIEIFWCNVCYAPIINEVTQIDKGICPRCGNKTKYLSKDLRPVFPEERLLLSLLLGKKLNEYISKSVWASQNRYYIDGKSISIPKSKYKNENTEKIAIILKKNIGLMSYQKFNEDIEIFCALNKNRLNYLVDEASEFINKTAHDFDDDKLVISFSGGKDSIVTADLVMKSLSDPNVVHIFGNTTLEFPTTIEFVERYRDIHPYTIFKIAKNDDQNFMDVCNDIGPPARMMRWCCSMFKTGPITRVLNKFYSNEQILTFYGIRKSESVSRSKYNRVEDDAASIKINKQTVASPIFFWHDIDIWLYILNEDLDFNDTYRFGYDRVGCWCCPNNNLRDQFLTKIHMPEESKEWRDFLIGFAKKVGKPDAEEYVDSGAWKARQGGNGLEVANDIKIKFTNCTSEENSKIYSLTRPYNDDLINLFVPFGKLAPELGSKILNETVVVHPITNIPIIRIMPFDDDGYNYAVKIKTENIKDHSDLQRKAAYQIRKFNACRKCLMCESVCKAGAISITGDDYYINPDKCIHCLMCVTPKYLRGGCMMDKYLCTKVEAY